MEQQFQSQVPSGRAIRPGAPRAADAAAILTARDIIMMLRQHVLLIILMTVSGLISGVGLWAVFYFYYPQYTATGYIKVLSPIDKDPTRIGEYVVNKENQYVFRTSLASLIIQQGSSSKLLDRDKIRDTKWFKSFGDIKSGKSNAVSIEKGLKNLGKNLSASAERDSDYIRVSMTCASREESAIIANEMIDIFLAGQSIEEVGSIREKLKSLSSQKSSIENEIAICRQALEAIKTRSGFSDLEKHYYQDVLTQRLGDLELENNNLVLEFSNTVTQMKAFERQANGPINEQIARMVEGDQVMQSLLQQRILLEAELVARLSKYGEGHRIIQQVQERINEINKQRQARAAEIGELIRQSNLKNGQDAIEVLKNRLVELQKQIGLVQKQKQGLDVARAQYDEQIVKRDEAQKRLAGINDSIGRYTVLLTDPATPKVEKISEAVEPLEVSFPQWQLFFPGGTVVGLLLGVALAFMLERLNTLVRTSRDVARYLHIPLLGSIPDADEDDLLNDIDPTFAIQKAPYSIISESYRNLRSNIVLTLPQKSKAFLVSSPSAAEGKTSVAVNLVASLVAQGKKVLLIDANFWQPKLNVIFPVPKPPDTSQQDHQNGSEEGEESNEHFEIGLSTVLTGLCGYHEVIRHSGIENLDVIDAGLLPPNPAELLGSSQMEQFIKHQSEKYDFVIVDGPPILLVGDAKLLAKIVDGTILVFNAASTTRGEALRTVGDLNLVGATILGCVLFAARALKGGYFRQQYKSYGKYQKIQLAKSAV